MRYQSARKSSIIICFKRDDFLSGFYLIFKDYEVQYYKNQKERVGNAVNYIQSLYDEASAISERLNLLPVSECSNELFNTLSRMAAVAPHMRSVNILKGNQVICSSMTASANRIVSDAYTGTLPVYTIKREVDGYIFYTLFLIQRESG